MSAAKKVINELLVEVFNHILSIEGSKLKERGVTISMNEMHVLEAIQKTSDPAMSKIARRLRVTVGTLTTSINATRKREDEDKRKVIISLTEKAFKVLKIHAEFHDEMLTAVFEDMNLEEDEVLIQALENLSDYFKNKY